MSASQTMMLSLIDLRGRCSEVIIERQEPIKARQARLRDLKIADHNAEAALLVKDAAGSEDPEALLDKAATLLVADDKVALMRELGEQAANLLDEKLMEIERQAGGLVIIDNTVTALREQATKMQIARVSRIGQSGYVDSSIERHIDANVASLKTAVALLRDRMDEPRITQACEQFISDLDEFIAALKEVAPL